MAWDLWLGIGLLVVLLAGYGWVSFRLVQRRRRLRFLTWRDQYRLRVWRRAALMGLVALTTGLVVSVFGRLLVF